MDLCRKIVVVFYLFSIKINPDTFEMFLWFGCGCYCFREVLSEIHFGIFMCGMSGVVFKINNYISYCLFYWRSTCGLCV